MNSSLLFINKNPKVTLYTAKNYYDKLYMKNQIQEYLNSYSKTLPTERLDTSEISIQDNILSFTLNKNGRKFETTKFIQKSDNNGKRIQAHIIKEDVIYVFMSDNIVNIIVYNY